MSIFSLLSMLDQAFEWSRLKIDHQVSPCVDGSETKSSSTMRLRILRFLNLQEKGYSW